MKVRELKDALEGLDDGAEVVLSRDEEGNGFSPLASVEPGKYDAGTTWGGGFLPRECAGNGEYDRLSDAAVDAVCLWPTN